MSESKDLEIEIHTANTDTGEPVVAVRIGENVSILPLDIALEVGQALIKAVAASKVEDEPEKSALILPSHEIKTLN